jgi:hypothetical protein
VNDKDEWWNSEAGQLCNLFECTIFCLAISIVRSILDWKDDEPVVHCCRGLMDCKRKRRLHSGSHAWFLGFRVVFAVDSWLVELDRAVMLVCTLALTLVVLNEDGSGKHDVHLGGVR